MKKNNRTILIIIGIVFIIAAAGFFIFQKNDTKLTSEERKWISENEQIVQNVYILNDTNIFGNLGEGVFYSFINDLTNTYDIKMNPVTVKKEESLTELAFLVGNTVPENAFTFYEDHYVLVGKVEESITAFSDIVNKNIGVLNNYSQYVQSFFGTTTNKFVEFGSLEELIGALDNGTVTNILVPRIEYIDLILSKKYWISYHFSDLKRNFYVQDPNNTIFYNIIKKHYQNWYKENLEPMLHVQERKVFLENLNITTASLDELQKNTLRFGYMKHLPYSVDGDTNFGGIIREVMKSFEEFAGLDIEYKGYKTDKKIVKALNDNKIDLYFNYSTAISTGANINTSIPINFDVYVHESNPLTINSIESLKNYTIYVEDNTTLYQKLLTYEGLNIKTYKAENRNDILKNKENILAMDSLKGEYLRKSQLKKYSSRFHYNLKSTYALRSLGNETLNTLLTKYINYVDNTKLINQGIFSAANAESRGSFLNSLAKYALYSVVLITVILLLIYRSSKKVRMQKKLKKEDKLKLIDQLTSLKNRNYLNENLPNWNKNTIYPQSIIMIDLNEIQEINDTLGYEEGDRQIRGASNILIRTQLDNTDIIRTDGDEFVVYLVGYSAKQITSYIHKLTKEFKKLPYTNHSVRISYSMILDDLKSIEDAMNECVEDIKKQKESK